MLRTIRIILATIAFLFVSLLFCDLTAPLHPYLSWMASIQFLPALLSLNFIIVAILLLITLIFGRIYCSVVCPLGILQDIFSWTHRKKNRFSFSREKRWLRYSVFILFIIAVCLGANTLVALVAPYSAFGRIASSISSPTRNAFVSLVALITIVILWILAWFGGRSYCNTICPIGTLLSFFARFSWLKLRINEDRCVSCGLCARNCKAACIDPKRHIIDYSRCIVCGNCIPHCHSDALVYSAPLRFKKKKDTATEGIDHGRRAFLVGTTLATATVLLAEDTKKMDGGLAIIEDKVNPTRQTPITPPGSLSYRNFHQHCTACQLCVSNCPNHVLQPSTSLSTFMQPNMSYTQGYCRTNCNTCSTLCPTGAIRPLSLEEKVSTQIGHAVWIKKNCVVLRDNVQCWACAGHCPTGAIRLVPINEEESSLLIPSIDVSRCIGCGECEYLCPSRPLSAIYVEGHEIHRER